MEKENTAPGDGSNGGESSHLTPTDSKGWDGKLRVDRRPVLQNPEAISDPEYSDEEHVIPGEEISADEGVFQNT
jgi:protein phosphatase 1 regulatory subunit 7